MLCISSIGFPFFFLNHRIDFYALNEAIVFRFGGWFVYSFLFFFFFCPPITESTFCPLNSIQEIIDN